MQSYRHPGAAWLGSPNFTPDRMGHDMAIQPAYVVIHTMVGTVAGANARFQQPAQQASAHYGVGLDGRLVQWVDEKDAAWHAGDFGVNLDSVGIEHEDGGQYDAPRPDALYAASAALVRDVCQRYGVPIDRAHIRKHSEVSDSPTSCPDALDIDRIVRQAAAGPAPAPTPPPEEELDMVILGIDKTADGTNIGYWLLSGALYTHIVDDESFNSLAGAGVKVISGISVAQHQALLAATQAQPGSAPVDLSSLVAAVTVLGKHLGVETA